MGRLPTSDALLLTRLDKKRDCQNWRFLLEGQVFLSCDANLSATPSGEGRMRDNGAGKNHFLNALSLKCCSVKSCRAKACRSLGLILVLAVSR